jgi:hypothetical protein
MNQNPITLDSSDELSFIVCDIIDLDLISHILLLWKVWIYKFFTNGLDNLY